MNLFKSTMKTALISYVLPIMLPALAVLAVACGYDQVSGGKMNLCKHPYALCTSALCVPQPGDPSKAICLCDVEEGPSMSTTPCDKLQPATDANGIQTVYSTFSFKQYNEGKKAMKCPSGTPWTWCLNKRCTVDTSNPKKAICVCDVVRTGEWTTLGGNCDTSTCETGYWSGATIKDSEEGNIFMTKALGIDKSPVKWCQAVTQ
jgi:hypothetical protein